MKFTVIDKETNREVSYEKIDKIAEKNDLMRCDIEGFAITEDGDLILLDECGNYCFANSIDFEVKFDVKKR